MKDTTYRCNLCRDSLDPETLYGLYWTHKGWQHEPAERCNTHLCERCLRSVGEIAEECSVVLAKEEP